MKNPISIVGYDSLRDTSILVGSEQWFTWLESVNSFRYEYADGSFTARRYNNYWNAYRKRFGKLRQEYLGKTQDLTLERLGEVCKVLGLPDEDYWLMKSEQKKSKASGYRENTSITIESNLNGYREKIL